MQDAKREIRDNDKDDQHEFEVEEQTNLSGEMTAEQVENFKKAKEEQEKARQRQKINDGISLTQGEIKKNETVDWDENANLNQVTK